MFILYVNYSLQSRNQLHVVFGCSQKVKLFCGSLWVQSTSCVGLNEIRSMVGAVVSRKYSTWQICIVPTSVRRSGKWDIALELNDPRIVEHLSSLHRPTVWKRIKFKAFCLIVIRKMCRCLHESIVGYVCTELEARTECLAFVEPLYESRHRIFHHSIKVFFCSFLSPDRHAVISGYRQRFTVRLVSYQEIPFCCETRRLITVFIQPANGLCPESLKVVSSSVALQS
jgi:hypothetical protein